MSNIKATSPLFEPDVKRGEIYELQPYDCYKPNCGGGCFFALVAAAVK